MGDKTGIAWTEATWNTVTGCTPVSEACKNCYAKAMHKRLQAMGQVKYFHDFDEIVCHDDERLLSQPARWTRPRKIFVNSMSDTFHREVPSSFIEKMYRAMIAAPQHIFQVLTKRAGAMRNNVTALYDRGILTHENSKHIWHGVTMEYVWSHARLVALRDTPTHVRFVSFEPLIGPVRDVALDGIDWFIIGGESGPGARPMNMSWVYEIIEEARKYDCKIFVKQMGAAWAKRHDSESSKGELMREWPEDLRVQEFPQWPRQPI